MSREIVYKYLIELKGEIIQSFEDIDLHFEWEAGWRNNPDPIQITDQDYGGKPLDPIWGVINIAGINNQIISELKHDDYDVIGRFVKDTVNNFRSLNYNFKVEVEAISVGTTVNIYNRPNVKGLWIRLDLNINNYE